MNVIIVGGGTAGLISALMLKHTYPDVNVKIIKSTIHYHLEAFQSITTYH